MRKTRKLWWSTLGAGLLAFILLVKLGGGAALAADPVAPSLSTSPTAIPCGGSTSVTLSVAGQGLALKQVDLMFVVDESGSINTSDFTKIKNAMVSMVSKLTFGANDFAVGIVQFSGDARLSVPITYVQSSVINFIDNTMYQRGGTTNTFAGLQTADTELFNGQGRVNATKVIVTITDGDWNVNVNQTPTEINTIKAQGVLMTSIGVGAAISSTNITLLSSTIAGVQTAYSLADYSTLDATLVQLAATISKPAATALTYTATTTADFQVTGATATKGTASHTASTVSWSLDQLETETPTLTYQLQHTDTNIGALPVQLPAATLSWTDSGGTAKSVALPAPTVTVASCDSTPPVITPTISGTLGANGWYTSDVTVSWSVVDAESTPTPATCPSTTISSDTAGQDVTCSATSAGGPSTQTVTIKRDASAPPPPSIAVNPPANAAGWNNSSPVAVSITAPADNGPSGITACTPGNSYSSETAGTSITATCTDAAGNVSAPATLTLKIDTTKPLITGTRVTNPNANGWSNTDVIVNFSCADQGAVASGLATDTVTNTTVSSEGQNQSVSNPGTCTDVAGNTATTTTVSGISIDKTPPSFSGTPADITREATSAAGAAVTYSAPTATDTLDPHPAVSCAPASGGSFPLGPTTVSCTATDAAGNTSSKSFSITVQDTTPPALSLPANQTAEATGPAGAAVTYTATATDLVDGSVTPACSLASGSTFALGTATVSCSATDAHHNSSTGAFTITVKDTKPPVISGVPANSTKEATGPAGAAVSYTPPTASDLVDGTVTVACAPASGSTFPLGPTTVTCTATDAHSNPATATFSITVRDTTAPAMTVPASLTAPATGPAGAVVTYSVVATDLVDQHPVVHCSPASGSTFAIGTATVSCTATDASTNSSTKSFTVTVTGAAPQLTDLLTAVTGVGPGKSLASKVQDAQSALQHSDTKGACGALNDFMSEVRAQSGKHVTTAQAQQFIDAATRIRAVLGC